MLSGAAICAGLESHAIPTDGRILTPETTMGMQLIERIRAAGLTLEVQR